MSSDFTHTDELARVAGLCNLPQCDDVSRRIAVVRHTNKAIVVRCPDRTTARMVSQALRTDAAGTCRVKKGLRSAAWYVEAW